jgi:predicted nucleotidyltransferase
MTADMSQAFSGRRSDLHTLAKSNINNKLRDIQLGNEIQFVLYGDSIYPIMSHIRKRHQNRMNTRRQVLENDVMKKVRISIEWNYGQTTNIFGYLDYRKNCKILAGGSNIAKCYVIGTLLKNCYNCFYGCQTASYFKMAPPSIESYLRYQ